jgi:hypothetical protein
VIKSLTAQHNVSFGIMAMQVGAQPWVLQQPVTITKLYTLYDFKHNLLLSWLSSKPR